jgi:hypothetical protein
MNKRQRLAKTHVPFEQFTVEKLDATVAYNVAIFGPATLSRCGWRGLLQLAAARTQLLP